MAAYYLVSPYEATLIVEPLGLPLPFTSAASVVAGDPIDIAAQCWNRFRSSAAVFAAGDVPSATLLQGSMTPIGAPSASWYTAPDPTTNAPTQTGYEQGQLLASLSASDTALLSPGLATLLIHVVPAAAPTQPELVARVRLVVERAD